MGLKFQQTVEEVQTELARRLDQAIIPNLRLRGWEDDAIRQIVRKAVVGLLDREGVSA